MNCAVYWASIFIQVIFHSHKSLAQGVSSWNEPELQRLSCDFDSTCYRDIMQDNVDDFDWSRSSYYKPPEWSNNRDEYMNVNGYTKYPGQVARLKTPAFSSNYSSYCISFSYYLMGPYVGQLEVIIEEKVRGVGQPIRNFSGIQSLYWNTGYIQFQPTDSFKVIFQATVGSTPSTSYIGLDDLEIQNGRCPLPPMPTQPSSIFEECTFESNPVLCGFTSLYRNRWEHRGATASNLPHDHTLSSASGHYIYTYRDKSVLYSPLLTSSGSEACFSFWYFISSGINGKIWIYLQPLYGHIRDLLAVSRQGHGDQWHLQNVSLPETIPATFYIVMIFERGNSINAVIDDFLYKQTPCGKLQVSGNCNFEQSLDECGYIQGGKYEDKFDWILSAGLINMAEETRPSVDHSFGKSSGHYMYLYIEASYFRTSGDSAKLYTPKLNATRNPRCLEFSYYVDGLEDAKLEVYLEIIHIGLVDRIWFSATPTESKWKLAKVTIQPTDYDFTIIFVATVGKSYSRATFAIDDITFDECEAADNYKGEFLCNFDTDIAGCGLWQRHDDDMDWLYFNNFNNYGLSASPTYMYIEGGGGKNAHIQTPTINNSGSTISIKFSVNMNFDPQLYLRVFIQKENDKKILIWEKIGTTQGWEHVEVLKENQSLTHFAISFEAVLGLSSNLGVIAIDDVNISSVNSSSSATIVIATVVPALVIIIIVIILIKLRKRRRSKPKDVPKTNTKNNADNALPDAIYEKNEYIYDSVYTE